MSLRGWRGLDADPRAITLVSVGLRLLAVIIGLVIATIDGALSRSWFTAVFLVALTVVAEALWQSTYSPWVPVMEMALAGVALGVAMPWSTAFLPYLLVAIASIGARAGVWIAVTALSAAAVTLVGFAAINSATFVGGTAIPITTWLAVSLMAALAGGWARMWANRTTSEDDRFRAAYDLLVELREVTEELPTGLNELSTAATVLERVREVIPFERGALLKTNGDKVGQPLAVYGNDSLPWYPSEDSWLMQRVLESQKPSHSTDWVDVPGGDAVQPLRRYRAIVPLFLEGSLIAVVMMQCREPFSEQRLNDAQDIVDANAFMLEASFVFGEIRALAISEERARLAREIHDGVAQELAGVAFLVDDIKARLTQDDLRSDVDAVRSELTRLISELRLSIFELRSVVESEEGLGAALSSYSREVGARAGLTVHLVLQEAESRLSPEVEMELLRIVQEAMANILKHAQAKNVWVMLRTSPPKATVRVSDDGIGLRPGRRDSFGLQIMRERAQRIGGAVEVRTRPGGGTVVEVSVEGNPGPRSRKRGTTKVEL